MVALGTVGVPDWLGGAEVDGHVVGAVDRVDVGAHPARLFVNANEGFHQLWPAPPVASNLDGDGEDPNELNERKDQSSCRRIQLFDHRFIEHELLLLLLLEGPLPTIHKAPSK